MADRIRAFDWAATPLGPIDRWPQSLKTAVEIMLGSHQMTRLAWGEELTHLYNDALVPLLGARHPHALGRPFTEVWPEPGLKDKCERAMAGEHRLYRDQSSEFPSRIGQPEEWFTGSWSPLRDETGEIRGFIASAIDTTSRMVAERRVRANEALQAFKLQLGDALRASRDPMVIKATASRLVGEHLRVERAAYGELEPGDEFMTVEREWCREGVASIAGRYRIDDFGAFATDELRRGRVAVMNDAAHDPRLPHDVYVRVWRAQLGIRAAIAWPIVRDGRLVAAFLIHHVPARDWTPDEIALVAEVGERTWDAVQRARAEAEMRQSEERFQQLARSVDAAFYVIDAQGRFQYLNDAYRRLWHVEPAELYRNCEAWMDLVHPDDAARVRGLQAALFRGTSAYESEYRIVLGDGIERWVRDRAKVGARDQGGAPCTITGMVEDITTEKLAGHLIRRSEEKYRYLFESIDQGFCLIEMIHRDGEPLDYRFIEVNPAFERQTGLVAAAGHTMRELAPEHEEHWFRIYDEVARTGQARRFELPALSLDRYFDVYAFRIGAPEQARVAILFADISDRRKMEEALRQADRRKDEFLATLAHELRNPLAPIRTGVALLRRFGTGDDAGATLEMMETQIQHLVRLVDDLLDISRISRGKVELRLEWVDLVEEVRAAGEAARAAYELQGRTLDMTLPSAPVMAHVDPTRLTQVIGNLLGNACKFTDEHGHVRLSLSREGEDAVVRVRDDGIGIAASQLDQIFSTFMQVDTSLERSQSGLGLGLAVAKELIDMHGGHIQASSPGLGQGSEFTIVLPLHKAPSSAIRAPVATARTALPTVEQASAPAAERRVLVVDDNHAAADALGVLLQMAGHDVRLAYEGREAVDMVRQWRPDAVVMDIGMPDLNGYEACRAMRTEAGARPFLAVALTGWGGADDLMRSREAGFDLHMVKPVEPRRIMDLLESLP